MRRLALATILALASVAIADAADGLQVSDVLKKTSLLMRERRYKEAHQLVKDSLQSDAQSPKLWLALGYVLEADGQYSDALKAFYRSKELKADTAGLNERIKRLEDLLKTQTKPVTTSSNPAAAEALAKARDYVEAGETKKGLAEFANAVHLDRALLATEQNLIDLGLKFFSNPENLYTNEEKNCYLGFYSFFAGNYKDAERELNAYVKNYPDGSEIERAKARLAEIAFIEEQMKTMKPPAKPALKPVAAEKPEEKQPDKPQQARQPEATPKEEKPVFPQPIDELAGLDASQLYNEAMAVVNQKPLKAMGILGRAISSDGAKPEYYKSLADLYAARKGFAKEAISTYRQIMDKFPGTVHAAEAKQKILEMNPSTDQRAREVSEYFEK